MENPVPKDREDQIMPFTYPIVERKYLERPVNQPNINFFDIIVNRRSQRTFNKLSLPQLSDLLWYTSKVYDLEVQQNGFIWTHRPTPSAGGRHPIDVIISLPDELSKRMLSYYNPIDHSINQLQLNANVLADFFNHVDKIMSIENATVIWFLAHLQRTNSKYLNAESLIWRDAGALIYCFQLVSCALNFNCCPMGSLGEPYVSELFKKYGDTFGAGGCLIGSDIERSS